MFWLMELDLLSLKGSAVSSSRFWSVFRFSMLLGSRSGFCGVRCVYFRSSFKVTLSITAVQPSPTCPWDHCRCICSPVPPCAASRNLLDRCLCGSFCVTATCVGNPQPPKLTRCVAGLCALDSQFPKSIL